MNTLIMRIQAVFAERNLRTRGILLWLLAVLALFSCAILFGNMAVSDGQVFPVYFSEILASNTSYPNSDGLCCDYIEIHNGADYPVDLSGFQMGDIAGKSRYAFPDGSVIQPDQYLAVYCSKTTDIGAYAPFEINRAGAEDFYLIAGNGAIVDSVTTIPMDIDQAMVLQSDDTWLLSDAATPGRANDTPGAAYGDIYNPEISPVRISEFSAADTGYLQQHGMLCDWIELHNSSAETADISGFILSDNIGNDKYIFPEGTFIGAHGYLVVNCSDRVADASVAPFGLSRQVSETVVLKNKLGMIVEIVHSEPMESGAMVLSPEGVWTVTDAPSPGYENTAQGYRNMLQDIGAAEGSIRISEVMSSQQLVLPDQFGDFSDWVELHNTTDRAIDLTGWCLSDDPAEPRKWMIQDLVIPGGERAVIFCSGRGIAASGEIHADFSLSAGGECLVLSSYLGNTVDAVSFPEATPHHSFTFDEAGTPVATDCPTPGYPNDASGYEAFCAAACAPGPLAIWEVMTSNDTYLPQLLGQCYDWVELRNVSGSPLDLSGFSISDDPDVPGMHTLSCTILQPGETVIVILSDEEGIALPGYEHALFALDAQDDQLFLFDAEGKLLDYVHIQDIPFGCSYGRYDDKGGFCYMEPSPQNPNFAGHRLISNTPVSSYVPGVYSQEGSFSVTLEANGTIYYTTDGSDPDASSALYTNTLQIEKTMVLRAVSIEEGKMPSDIYTATFIIGDVHELPVVSLVTDPEGLWGKNGIYKVGDISVKEIQLPAHVSYCGSDGSFAINCAVNLHGATTVEYFNKKTFAVRFQNRFDGPLHYDVFEDGEVTTFSSLLIRTAYESSFSSQMHDALICHIASQSSDKLLTQKYKYVSLYINGEYWGLYALRERHSAEHYASYMHEPAEQVNIVRFMIDEENSLHNLYDFSESHSFASDENYAYAKTVLDMESYVDWIIFEAYMANIDINANIRFYQSPVDGLWRVGLTDLDLGMVGSIAAFDGVASAFHHGRLVSALMKNEEFQHLLATRLAELLEGPLSDENMIATINHMADTIRPEAPWEAARWGTPVGNWESTVQEMIRFCDGRSLEMIDSLCMELRFTKQEREAYFGHLE